MPRFRHKERVQVTQLNGPKILIQGDSGTGKTYSLGTIVDWAAKHEREVFVLFIENGLETLLGYWKDRELEVPPCLHWHTVAAPSVSLDALISASKDVGLLSYEALTKKTDPNRAANNPYERILRVFSDFPDDRSGTKFGNVGKWDNTRILCIDSLSELAFACMKMVIGTKPTAAPPDYGVAQNNLINLLRFFTQGFAPTLVMTAHVDRLEDKISRTVKLTTKSIGHALASEIPQLFSEVLFAYREGAAWFWDTASPSAVTKTRYLPVQAKLKPDLGTIMDKWLLRGAV